MKCHQVYQGGSILRKINCLNFRRIFPENTKKNPEINFPKIDPTVTNIDFSTDSPLSFPNSFLIQFC